MARGLLRGPKAQVLVRKIGAEKKAAIAEEASSNSAKTVYLREIAQQLAEKLVLMAGGPAVPKAQDRAPRLPQLLGPLALLVTRGHDVDSRGPSSLG